MRVLHWEFRPRLSATLAALSVTPLLVALGFWQLHRAAEKEALHDAFLARSEGAAVDINDAGPRGLDADYMQFRRARVHGSFVAGDVLLDNQVQEGEAGYDVYSPLRLPDSDRVLLVNRGWIAAGPDRRATPSIETPAGPVELIGAARLPSVPLMLADSPPEKLENGRLRVQRVDLAEISALRHWRLYPYELRLDAASPAGFARDWPVPGSGRERHLGYAFQWFAMAATAVVLYLWLNLRRRAPQ